MTLKEAETTIAPEITPEFMAVLIEAFRIIGHGVDAVESWSFVREVADLGRLDLPPQNAPEPYEDD